MGGAEKAGYGDATLPAGGEGSESDKGNVAGGETGAAYSDGGDSEEDGRMRVRGVCD